MKNWLLYLGAIGILTVTIASITYIWQQISAYQLQKRAERYCQSQMTDYKDEDEHWIAVRACLNDIVGIRRAEDHSSEMQSLETRVGDVESTLNSEVAALRSEIASLQLDVSLRNIRPFPK